ncbi:Outer membrane protein assembly factor BamB, contains PQQ-like beta-propeller repeat [Halopelagius inordinatus]|uniref:Outer membrane protein assembly factor BamB, contains PQQ-like beta-propeller repeat n=1 Tax=Halopelagius inordinatus TaxID=553467 RepID=A0A1I2SY20_9EURY|nr:PQQ-binding-like beta-propeller repeat protein [Halopelagius inordinatus]SFG57612.1 Outer membrane protein assembly factor BamB, contains PQQ-like beta-propeller repeat [Halopelagius inordinatus]
MCPLSRRRALAAVGSAAAFGTAGCLGLRDRYVPRTHERDADLSGDDGPWPTLGHDARRTASVAGTGPDANARVTRLTEANRFPDRQVVVGSDVLLFVVRRWRENDRDDELFSGVVAVDREGSERWRLRTEPDVGVPTAVGNTVFVEESNLTRAVDAETGVVNWRYRRGYGFPHVSPAVRDGRVYVGGRRFLALDAATGERLWRTDEEMPAVQTCSATAGRVVASNGYAENGGGLFCLDAADGSVRWEADVAPTHDPAAVGERRCFSVDDEGALSAVSTADGSVQWTRARAADGDRSRYEQPVLADGVVLVGGANAPLRAFDRETGETAWTAGPADERHYAPVVAADGVYGVTREGTVYEVGVEGTERWRRSLDRTVTSAPSLAEGALYFGSRTGERVERWQGGFDRFGP